MFQVLEKLNTERLSDYKREQLTAHMKEERRARLEAYNTGAYLDGFKVDKGHKNGAEVHIIDARGYILIFNEASARLITIESGRPAQIRRYFVALKMRYSKDIAQAIQEARTRNEETGANYI